MDEYIKREDALDAVLFALVGTGLQSCAIYAIRDVPTADVVPKSEVEKIFAEIEKIRLKEIHKCETLREQENEVSQRKYWEGGYNSLRQLSYWIAELEKKYVVETSIVRDLAEEAVNRDITNKQNEE